MKQFEISAYGVEEMKCQELTSIDAGTEIGYWLGYHGTNLLTVPHYGATMLAAYMTYWFR